jgi:membrane-associated phospholipid phosphatase
VKKSLFLAIAVVTLVVLSTRLVDLPLAGWIAENLRSHALYGKTAHIPDLLPAIVLALLCLSWIGYFLSARRNTRGRCTHFCYVMGTVLPFSLAAKMVLQRLFGRIEARVWLSDPDSYGFHWFHGTGSFRGFPSGHMLVFTPLFLVLWHFYPRYRLLYGIMWLGLAAALIATDYHFLSDVIAGAYIGTVVYLVVMRVISKSQTGNQMRRNEP